MAVRPLLGATPGSHLTSSVGPRDLGGNATGRKPFVPHTRIPDSGNHSSITLRLDRTYIGNRFAQALQFPIFAHLPFLDMRDQKHTGVISLLTGPAT
jgi:hypothetical protein